MGDEAKNYRTMDDFKNVVKCRKSHENSSVEYEDTIQCKLAS